MKKANDQKNKAKASRPTVSRVLAATAPRLTIECIERYELLLCGCRKIEAYSPDMALLSTHSCKVAVNGAKLRIAFSGDGKILLSGIISSIEFK